MLYVTTRTDKDVYTAHRVLCQKYGPDGGLFVPFRAPRFTPEQIDGFSRMSFSACVAELLNIQFHVSLTAWDVDLAVGRYPVRLQKLSQKILCVQCWHNTHGLLDRMVEKLAVLVAGSREESLEGDWIGIAVRIGILFGIYGELKRAGIASMEVPFDVACVSGDFLGPVSALYARSWGLPVGNVVCCCNENSNLWNFFSHGQLRVESNPVSSCLPAADVKVPENLERMIHTVSDEEETTRFAKCVASGSSYYLPPHFLPNLRQGIYICVVSQVRSLSTISNVYGSGGYLLSPYDALCYAGILDYRARTGSNGYALIFSERSPGLDAKTIADALNITVLEAEYRIDQM